MPTNDAPWAVPARVAFRFAFVYFHLYFFPAPLHGFPLAWPYFEARDAAMAWLAEHALGLGAVPRQATGSGDRTVDWLFAAAALALSALIAAGWTALDRRPKGHRRLWAWQRIYLRYVLGLTAVSYGLVKVLEVQFPFPDPARLAQPLGEFTPMGLMWSFMGASTAYSAFAGALEILGGALLFARRTTTLGALILAGVLGNVLMLNLSYDVPVKLFSAHLVAVALFLAAPDARRLLDALVLNRAAAPADLGLRPWPERFGRAALAAKAVLLAGLLGSSAWGAYESYVERGDGAAKSPLHGLYAVSEGARWQRVGITASRLVYAGEDGVARRFHARYDAASATLTLTDWDDPQLAYPLKVSLPGQGALLLEGDLEGAPLRVRLARRDPAALPLVNRGFHWVNEAPFNR